MKNNLLKPIKVTEKEVSDLAWNRMSKNHIKAFILLSLLMGVFVIVWSLPTHLNHALHTALFFVGFFAWLSAMYFYFNPKYQALKKELLQEWDGKAST